MPHQLSTPTPNYVNPKAQPQPNAHQMLLEDRTARAAVLLLRISLGIVFIAHAWLKLDGYTLPGTAEFFRTHGFPGWSAYPVFLVE